MSKQLESILRQSGLLTDAQLARDVDQARKQGTTLLEIILKEERVSEDQLADMYAARTKTPRIRVAASSVDPDAMLKVPDKLARRLLCLPISIEGKVITVAMADPGDYLAIQDIEFASGLSVRPVVATRTEILDGIDERYAAEDRIGSFLANVPEVTDLHIVSDDSAQDLVVEVADSRSAAEVAPVVKMCNLIVHDAIAAGASDTHIEPTMHDIQVRMRVDGVLRDYTHVPKWLHSPLVSRLKILAKLDISERRLPQDGRINVQYQGRSIDIRVSTLPTHFGEKAVLRFLGGGTLPRVDRMGLNEAQTAILEGVIRQPQGMILVTGPTGSGKTTTLYALLAKRKSPEVNIVTVEDPIEYQLPGINQVQINPKAGLSFASVLRSILRQDPDVILVGETRDRETAEVAFQAAMTGHLVLSTLHTNSAVAAVPRLYDLEVDPSILATSLTLVIAQRLVRRICDECKEAYLPDPATALKVGLLPADGQVYRGRGCQSCGGTGFSGRVGIYEFFRPTTAIRKLITNKASENDLRSAARQGGMKLLREDALDKVKRGITSPDEVLRVVQVDETEVPCPQCGGLIEVDFSTCPYCLSSLKKSCTSCGQDLKIEWKACPYCNAPDAAVIVAAAGGAASVVAPALPEIASTRMADARVTPAAAPMPPAAVPVAPISPAPVSGAPPPTQVMPATPATHAPQVSQATPVTSVPHARPATHAPQAAHVAPVAHVPVASAPLSAAPTPAAPSPSLVSTDAMKWPGVRTFDFDEPAPSEAAAPSANAPSERSIPNAPSTHNMPPVPSTVAASAPPAAPPTEPVPPTTWAAPAGIPVEDLSSWAPPVPTVPMYPDDPIAPVVLRDPINLREEIRPRDPIHSIHPIDPVAPSDPIHSIHSLDLLDPIDPIDPIASAPPTALPDPSAPSASSVPIAPIDVAPMTRRLRILVVDDDDDIRQVVAFTLKKLAVPVDVIQAMDGQEAVELAEQHPPDLVVLDIMMPRLDGFETCAKLRQNVRTAFVPILMLTASADEASRSKGYLVGTDDYMSKPFQPLDLKLRVTRLLRRTYGV
jgi:type IV pilus assembly protein PilB